MDVENENFFGRDAYEVGCYGLAAGIAITTNAGQRVRASDVTRANGPFHCADCFTDAVVRKCAEKIDHFAHKARLSPVIARGESELHVNCKKELCNALSSRLPNGKWAYERPIPPNKNRMTPQLVPDVSGYIGDQRVVIEIQASSLTIPKIVKRAVDYHKWKCPILWIVPLTEELGSQDFRPRLYERYLHSIYFGRTYYWVPGDGLSLFPVHYGVAYRYIAESQLYESTGDVHQAGGYHKPYKIVKKPIYGERVDLIDDFQLDVRNEFTPWNERKAVPQLTIWRDKLPVWWDQTEQKDFEHRYKNSGNAL